MENVFDIKYKQKLEYILPVTADDVDINRSEGIMDSAAVVMYFYYTDTVSNYFSYIDRIERNIKVFVVTPLEEIVQIINDEACRREWMNVEVIIKPNRGRDVSGLLIAAKDIVSRYEYICFIHDKKAHFKETEEDVALWIENMWENLLKNANHVRNIIGILKSDKKLGILATPAPIGKVFKVWYGYGWRDCFEATKSLAKRLNLNCNLDEKKPPITIGTTFWFRSEALKKLFDYPWKYEDFDDDKLSNKEYLSYAIERIFAYVAQDAGFTTGEVMTVEYAQKQTLFLQYSLAEIFGKLHKFYPFPTYENALNIDDNLKDLSQYAGMKENIFIYGNGDVGRFCAGYLRKTGCEPLGFLVSEIPDDSMTDNLPVFSIEKLQKEGLLNSGVVITAASKKEQNEMIEKLISFGIEDYLVFLKEAR